MYLMFMFSINIGSAFIDLFDGLGAVLFVEGPRQLLNAIGLPGWLVAFIADGVGGGVQLVGTFIPVIGALFLALSFLEDSGYMGRVAFIVDRLVDGSWPKFLHPYPLSEKYFLVSCKPAPDAQPLQHA